MGFKELRQNTPIEEFDYQFLMSHLCEYSNKRNAVTRLMDNEQIIRVKKGLYIFGPAYRKGPICKQSLAHQIYSPSYISCEYALSFYGMIPERVEAITCATTGRSREFHTPVGFFSYKHLPLKKYTVGFTWKQLDDYHAMFIATPEKALLDYIYFSKGLSEKIDLKDYFYEDLRIEKSSLMTLSQDKLTEIANAFSSAKINRVVKFIKELQDNA